MKSWMDGWMAFIIESCTDMIATGFCFLKVPLSVHFLEAQAALQVKFQRIRIRCKINVGDVK